jgi:hypothetical protein
MKDALPPRAQPADAVDDLAPAERRRAFLARLGRMSPEERLRAARYEFAPWQRGLWLARYPEEAPTVNGECEWIALRIADLD